MSPYAGGNPGKQDPRFLGGKLAAVATYSSGGNHDLLTPGPGKQIRVYWLSWIPNGDNTSANLVDIGFGTTGGAISTPLYRAYAMAHWEQFTGQVDESLIVTTQNAEPVAVTVHYREITPL